MGYKKGYLSERDLKLKLEADGWRVIRSGGSKKPDLIAGKAGKRMVIECKATNNSTVYISEDEIVNLKEVATAFGAVPIIAVKQKNKKWNFVDADKSTKVGKFFAVKNTD